MIFFFIFFLFQLMQCVKLAALSPNVRWKWVNFLLLVKFVLSFVIIFNGFAFGDNLTSWRWRAVIFMFKSQVENAKFKIQTFMNSVVYDYHSMSETAFKDWPILRLNFMLLQLPTNYKHLQLETHCLQIYQNSNNVFLFLEFFLCY